MGCGLSRIHNEALNSAITVLVLGPESSGKSALIRHVELALTVNSDDASRLTMSGLIRAMIRAELARVAATAIDAAALDPGAVSTSGLGTKSESLLGVIEGEPRINREVSNMIDGLFKSGTLQKMYDLAQIEPLSGNVAFVRDLVQRSCAPDYVPTDQDLILSQWSTRGVQIRDYVPGPNKSRVRFMDVGGSVQEQRKWSALVENSFQEIVFVIPLDSAVKTGPGGVNQLISNLELLRRALAVMSTKANLPVFHVAITKRDRLEQMACEGFAHAISSLPASFAGVKSSRDLVPVIDEEVKKIFAAQGVHYCGIQILDCSASKDEVTESIKRFVDDVRNNNTISNKS